MKLTFINETRKSIPRRRLQEFLAGARSELRRTRVVVPSGLELTLVFVSSRRIKGLNRQYRRRNYATDVLSFQGDGRETLGDLVLCPDVLTRQAREQGHSYRHELGYMVLHGLLHLLGYDHERSQRDAKVMFALQDRIFAKLRPLL